MRTRCLGVSNTRHLRREATAEPLFRRGSVGAEVPVAARSTGTAALRVALCAAPGTVGRDHDLTVAGTVKLCTEPV